VSVPPHNDGREFEPTRRTMLAAERTDLWIAGLTLARAALAIGTLAVILVEA
jgi:hypothetical protein